MLSRNPKRSIVHPPTLEPLPFVLATVVWALVFYAVPLALLLHYWWSGRLEQERHGVRSLPWLKALQTFSPVDLRLAAVVGGAFVLLVVAGFLLVTYVRRVGEGESETREWLLGLSDNTGVQSLERWLLIAPSVLFIVLALMRTAASLELLLAGGILLGLILGSRALPRFVTEDETLLPYSDEKLQELFAQQEGNGVSAVTYRWRFKEYPYLSQSPEKEFRFTMPFNKEHYDAAVAKDHDVRSEFDYAHFVVDDLTTEEVVMVAAQLKEIHEKEGYTRFQQVRNVLAFSGQFRYAYDEDTKGVLEYPRYPVEMLWDREGDCECHAILAAALLKLLGFDAVLLVLDFAQGPGHVAVGVAGADDMPRDLTFYEFEFKRYFYCEATPPTDGEGTWEWLIGVMPFDDPARVTPVTLQMPVTAA